jgi:DNA-binding LytR/AlgR family response regulator
MGRDVIYMEAQEHYLRVVLVGGEQLLLHGLANAIRELEVSGAGGMQVHRSYWVNWAHVRRVVADSGGGYCELAGGIRIPVSRRRAAAVRAAFHAFPGGGSAAQDA